MSVVRLARPGVESSLFLPPVLAQRVIPQLSLVGQSYSGVMSARFKQINDFSRYAWNNLFRAAIRKVYIVSFRPWVRGGGGRMWEDGGYFVAGSVQLSTDRCHSQLARERSPTSCRFLATGRRSLRNGLFGADQLRSVINDRALRQSPIRFIHSD